MAKETKISKSDSEQVTDLIRKLDSRHAAIIERIRQTILKTDKAIGERVKWNSPSFYYTGEMKSFDPKEYKRDIAVLNLNKGRTLLVMPSGAKVDDGSGFLEGDYKDGRRMITFANEADVSAKEKRLRKVITDWLKLVDKE